MSTGVDTQHKAVIRRSFEWRMMRDVIEGTDAVKRGNVVYLPMPLGFEVDDEAASATTGMAVSSIGDLTEQYDTSNAPWWHNNPAYRAYLQRARFPEITLNTLRGLLGVATKTDAEVKLPSSMAYLEERATKQGHTLQELFVMCLAAVLSGGRCAIVVDIDEETNEARLVLYKTQNIPNWRVNTVTGETEMAVVKECIMVPTADSEFECEESMLYGVYKKVSVEAGTEFAGKVVLEKYMGDELLGTIVPSLQGKEFETVPVIPIGSLHNEFDPGPVPLSSIAEIALSIYRKDADLSQAQYMTCNPIFTITGASGDAIPTAFGSTVALVLENPDAKAFFPETDTSALEHVRTAIQDLFDEAAKYGATLLGPSKTTAEATETVRLRMGQQGATLVGVVNNVMAGINTALEVVAQIEGATLEDVAFSVSTDFAETMLDAQMALALMQLWQNGLYSKESFIKLLIENGFIDSAEEVEDELARIFNEAPAPEPTALDVAPNDQDD